MRIRAHAGRNPLILVFEGELVLGLIEKIMISEFHTPLSIFQSRGSHHTTRTLYYRSSVLRKTIPV